MRLDDYKSFIEDSGFVSSDKSHYYVYWVKRFFSLNLSKKLSDVDKIVQFVESLKVDSTLADWQRAQGRQAVEIYLNLFLPDGGVVSHTVKSVEPSVYDDIFGKLREALRLKHYAYKTEKSYLDWARRYFDFCEEECLDSHVEDSVKRFLTFLAVKREVAPSTQNQAFNALLFLFKRVFECSVVDFQGAVRAKERKNLPVVLSVDEIRGVFAELVGTRRLMLELIYGCGLRVSELVRLRVKDLDFGNGVLIVKDGKGGKDRSVPLPVKLVDVLQKHLLEVKELHDRDLDLGYGDVFLPGALSRKYPSAGREWKWQYVFPSAKLAVDPRSGVVRRHHVLDRTVQKVMKRAVDGAGIHKKATVHTLRHSFATHLLLSGVNIREIQELLGHKSVDTTMIYTHVAKELRPKLESPLDSL